MLSCVTYFPVVKFSARVKGGTVAESLKNIPQ